MFFYEWSDAVIVFGFACIIRDRYLAYQSREKEFQRSNLPLIILMGMVGLACLLVIIQTAAYNGLALHQPTEINNRLDFEHLLAYIRLENRVNDTVAAFKVVSALLLAPLAIWAKKRIGYDPVSVSQHPHEVIPYPFPSRFTDSQINSYRYRSSHGSPRSGVHRRHRPCGHAL